MRGDRGKSGGDRGSSRVRIRPSARFPTRRTLQHLFYKPVEVRTSPSGPEKFLKFFLEILGENFSDLMISTNFAAMAQAAAAVQAAVQQQAATSNEANAANIEKIKNLQSAAGKMTNFSIAAIMNEERGKRNSIEKSGKNISK